MKLTQISIFLENRPGRLRAPCQILADRGINILTLSLADTQQFGILRLIVREPARAKAALEEAGYVVHLSDVVALEVRDRPGGLAEVLAHVDEGGLNVEYMYAFTFGRGDRAVLIFRFENADRAAALLQSKGVNVLGEVELFERGAS
ncbi:MAG: ACT domain-containing protein [Gammaproteobacteria bacterium]|nr:ACT domain-containing protein [Gammaproteobacteria bacterium]